MPISTTLVLGASGKTGRRVAQRLQRLGRPVRHGSRTAQPAFDWDDPRTWDAVLDGVGAVFISYYPDLAFAGADRTMREFVAQATRHGVRRLVLLSGRGEEGARRGEDIVRESGCQWTIVRSSWFCQNFDEGHLLEPLLAGVVALPAADVAEPFVDADDIADVALAALTDERHGGQIYEVTGPRLLTFSQAIQTINAVSGLKARFVSVAPLDYMAAVSEFVPEEMAKGLTALFSEVLDGRNAHLADGVQRALGRAPTDFADYARKAAATGVWGRATQA